MMSFCSVTKRRLPPPPPLSRCCAAPIPLPSHAFAHLHPPPSPHSCRLRSKRRRAAHRHCIAPDFKNKMRCDTNQLCNKMSSIGTGYDLDCTSYSPDGRIFQIEYAGKAVENSGTLARLLKKSALDTCRNFVNFFCLCRYRFGRAMH